MQREVKITIEKESIIGAWNVKCPTCPLLPHLNALGEKPRTCCAGISTNLQGAIPMKFCKSYKKDSVTSEGKRVFIECEHKEDNESTK